MAAGFQGRKTTPGEETAEPKLHPGAGRTTGGRQATFSRRKIAPPLLTSADSRQMQPDQDARRAPRIRLRGKWQGSRGGRDRPAFRASTSSRVFMQAMITPGARHLRAGEQQVAHRIVRGQMRPMRGRMQRPLGRGAGIPSGSETRYTALLRGVESGDTVAARTGTAAGVAVDDLLCRIDAFCMADDDDAAAVGLQSCAEQNTFCHIISAACDVVPPSRQTCRRVSETASRHEMLHARGSRSSIAERGQRGVDLHARCLRAQLRGTDQQRLEGG